MGNALNSALQAWEVRLAVADNHVWLALLQSFTTSRNVLFHLPFHQMAKNRQSHST